MPSIYITGLGPHFRKWMNEQGLTDDSIKEIFDHNPEDVFALLAGDQQRPALTAMLGLSTSQCNITLDVTPPASIQAEPPRLVEMKSAAFKIIVAEQLTRSLSVYLNVMKQIEQKYEMAVQTEAPMGRRSYRKLDQAFAVAEDEVREMIRIAKDGPLLFTPGSNGGA